MVASTAVEAGLGLRNLRQAFTSPGRRVLALDNVSLDVRRGEFLTIVGLSGCGKSTLLNLIVVMAVVMLVNWLLDRAEAHLLRWRPAGPDASSTQG